MPKFLSSPRHALFFLKCLRPFGLLCAIFLAYGVAYAQNYQTPEPRPHEDVLQSPKTLQSFTHEPSQDTENETVPVSSLTLHATLKKHGPHVTNGLVWRVYSPIVGMDNKLPLLKVVSGGSAHLNLQPGTYFIHVAFGHASASKRITLQKEQDLVENINIEAGGLMMSAVVADGKINKQRLRFSIFKYNADKNEQTLILANVKPDVVVRLDAGTYHVVSNYGSVNAVIRTDMKVEAGKLSEATVQHQAAQLTLKLVRQPGGEAMAETNWSIMNESGDIVVEATGAYASIVLTEGDYIAVAKNRDFFSQKKISVTSGNDQVIEILAEQKENQVVIPSVD